MALNPAAFTENVVRSFLRYQLTTYPFADERLHGQMRKLLSLDETRRTPLLKGPYVSLSRSFRQGPLVSELVSEGVLHPGMSGIVEHPRLYGHQERAIRSIVGGRTTLVSTGTGSGKTECFLYPVISRCFELRDAQAPAGISAVLVYPMNALAEDQLARLRELLAGTGITFGMYVGKTPERKADAVGLRLPVGASRTDFRTRLAEEREKDRAAVVFPPEERPTREEMRSPGGQPRILLTNIKQLELLLTRQKDVELFDNARLDHLVFDEAHTCSGVTGAETAALIRRIKAFCRDSAEGKDVENVCVATSATIVDPRGDGGEARGFARRFFGVAEESVEIVAEQYDPHEWGGDRSDPGAPAGDVREVLKECLEAVEADPDRPERLAAAFTRLTGDVLDESRWAEDLYDKLLSNEVVFRLAETLSSPRSLEEVLVDVAEALGRDVSEEEMIAYLALGAAARRGDRPLLRPVVHGFVRGVGGAVVTFPGGQDGPKLWLSAEDAARADDDLPEPHTKLGVLSCSTCGQHYFEHAVEDWEFQDGRPEGGEAVDDRWMWRAMDQSHGGKRLVLLDSIISLEDDEDDPGKTARVWLCRHCGTLHPADRDRCDSCARSGPLVNLLTVQQKEEHPGKLTRCVSCGQLGRWWQAWYREPARPVKAVPVADVHVLSQDMIQNADRRRLLVFADNRQEAAFQAGWMRDHARRYRLRSLMYERIRASESLAIGDLTAWLDEALDADDELSRILAPEVWQQIYKEETGVAHQKERRHFLRLHVLREAATGPSQRVGLEPYGRVRFAYHGLSPSSSFVTASADRLGIDPGMMIDGIAGLLDKARRGRLLFDKPTSVFSKFWGDGDREIMYGYLPDMRGVPKGLKLRREGAEEAKRVSHWISAAGGGTAVMQTVKKWGVATDEVVEFLESLWQYLVKDAKVIVPVTLTGQRGNPLPNCAGTFQVSAERVLFVPHRGYWRCTKCRRSQPRPSPHDLCQAYRCDGTLQFIEEDPDNYDLAMLDDGSAMVRAREHSAMVPNDERDRIERQFKGDGEMINALVCTPTLELGVDIGALDSVLMRNVPPLPANYWQRVGRAGRRHRMAVNLTYARPSSHDRVYFHEPEKMLSGRVEPPRFNLRNDLLVAKHVNACVLTNLHQFARPTSTLSESDRAELAGALHLYFPSTIQSYLFDEAGHVRTTPLDVSALRTQTGKHLGQLESAILAAFNQTWPAEDAAYAAPEKLRAVLERFPDQLERVMGSLKKRLDWALGQMRRLDDRRRTKGTLDPDEDWLYRRCDELIKRLKGQSSHQRSRSEGYDDTETYGVLASEGFLPGYGLEIGSVTGHAKMPRGFGTADFDLPRPSSIAVREYVPGNLIYANSHRFVARHFHLEPTDPLLVRVDAASESAREVGIGQSGAAGEAESMSGRSLPCVPICDVDLAHQSTISDEEDNRFQLPVAVYGSESGRHEGGAAYQWGGQDLHLRKAVHMRLINVGASRRVAEGRLGFPLCRVCGQSRSPFASDAELVKFESDHHSRCGKPIEWSGYYADIVSDAISLPSLSNRREAYSVLETIRTGAARVLDMERDDLEILVIGRPGTEEVDGLLFDPMPGGSGLLEQIVERFEEVHEASLELTEGCPSACQVSCVDCLQTFRNAHSHRNLDRHTASACLGVWGAPLIFSHPIPPKMPDVPQGAADLPANVAEGTLRDLLGRAGFPTPEWHKQILLGAPLGSTSPDCFWAGSDSRDDPGVCLYLDGLSARLHGRPETQQMDRSIREELRARQYAVVEIPATSLADRAAMGEKFYELAMVLLGRQDAMRVRRTADNWLP